MKRTGRPRKWRSFFGEIKVKRLICCVALLGALSAAAATAADAYHKPYKDGVAKFKARDYEACRKLMAQALEKAENPNQRARCLLYVGRSWLAEKNFKAARETCATVLGMKGVSTARRLDALRLTAKICSTEGNRAGAREALSKILETKGLAPAVVVQTHSDLAQTYFYEGNRPAALKAFKKVIAMPEAHANDKAPACLLAADCTPDAAGRRELLAKVLTLKKVSPGYLVQARYRIARTYMDEKNYPAAKAEFDRVLKMGHLDAKTKKRVVAQLEKIRSALSEPRGATSVKTPVGLSGALNIIPTPQQYEAREGRLVLVKDGRPQAAILLSEKPDRKEELAAAYIAREVRRLSKAELPVLRGGKAGNVPTRIRLGAAAGALSEADAAFLKSEKTGQGYVLDAGATEARIVGSSPQGTLFGAMTLLQMIECAGEDLAVQGALIRDYPDFREREVGSAYVSTPKALDAARDAVDFALRHKVNVLATAVPRRNYVANAESVRRINAYARERGIRGALYVFMGGLTPPDDPGAPLLNRRSYPDGELYRCMGQQRSPKDRDTLRWCASNDAMHERMARNIAEYIRRMEPGHTELHAIDNDRWALGKQIWQRRCDQCRKRWPSDDLASMEGLAGAQAYYWNRIIEAIQSVRNADSGYDARRDLTMRIVFPIYCNVAEDDATFEKEMAFYRAISRGLKHKDNVLFCTRELGRNKDGRKRFEMMGTMLRENGVQYMGWIWAGNREHPGWPQAHRHYFWFSPLPVMLKAFEGADHLLVAGNYTLMAQLIGAEYAWNTKSSGWLDPATNGEYLRNFRALGKSRVTPPAIYGPGGFVERACRNMVGEQAGAHMMKGWLTRRTLGGRTVTPMFNFAARKKTIGPWEKACKDGSAKRPVTLAAWEQLWRTYAEIGQEAARCFRKAMRQKGFKTALPHVRQQTALLAAVVQELSNVASKNAAAAAALAAELKRTAPAAAEAPSWPRVSRKPKGSAIEVGVFDNAAYLSLGAKPLAQALQGTRGLKVRFLDALTPDALADCDVLLLHAIKPLPDRWRAAVARFVGEGRGLLLVHDAVGYRRFGPSLFPKIVKGGTTHVQINQAKVVGRHAVTAGLDDGATFTHSYSDHVLLLPGKRGVAVLGEEGTEIGQDVHPILVVGEWGHGRVAFSGILFGYNERGQKADPEEGRILTNLIRWLAEPRME